MNSMEVHVLVLIKELNAFMSRGNKSKILKGPSRVMYIVDSDFRDNHKKVLQISRENSGYLIIMGTNVELYK